MSYGYIRVVCTYPSSILIWALVGLQLGPERAHVGMLLDNIAVEGTVSQFFYIGPGSFFFLLL